MGIRKVQPRAKLASTQRKKNRRGRQETRHYTIMPLSESMSAFGKKWSGLKSIGRVVREVQQEGKQASKTSYSINNLEAKVGIFSDSVRSLGASRIACTG